MKTVERSREEATKGDCVKCSINDLEQVLK